MADLAGRRNRKGRTEERKTRPRSPNPHAPDPGEEEKRRPTMNRHGKTRNLVISPSICRFQMRK